MEHAERLAAKYGKEKPAEQPGFYLLKVNSGNIHAERIKITRPVAMDTRSRPARQRTRQGSLAHDRRTAGRHIHPEYFRSVEINHRTVVHHQLQRHGDVLRRVGDKKGAAKISGDVLLLRIGPEADQCAFVRVTVAELGAS